MALYKAEILECSGPMFMASDSERVIVDFNVATGIFHPFAMIRH